MPQGPAQADRLLSVTAIHPPLRGGGGGSFVPSGKPDSRREESGSGPFGPIFFGVWQLHELIQRVRSLVTSASARRRRWSIHSRMLENTLQTQARPNKPTPARPVRSSVPSPGI